MTTDAIFTPYKLMSRSVNRLVSLNMPVTLAGREIHVHVYDFQQGMFNENNIYSMKIERITVLLS